MINSHLPAVGKGLFVAIWWVLIRYIALSVMRQFHEKTLKNTVKTIYYPTITNDGAAQTTCMISLMYCAWFGLLELGYNHISSTFAKIYARITEPLLKDFYLLPGWDTNRYWLLCRLNLPLRAKRCSHIGNAIFCWYECTIALGRSDTSLVFDQSSSW